MPSFTSIIATGLVAISSVFAYTTPTTFNQTSNPVFTPSAGQRVPVSKPFKITWGPNSSGTVTLVLLRGPAKNIQPLYAIAEKIPNSGSYSWTPKSDLEDDTTHYGLQVIEDSNGQFQYSVQFGISNPDYHSSSSAVSSHVSTATSSAVYTSVEATTSSYVTVSHTIKSSVTSLITVTTAHSSSTPISSYAPSSTTTLIVTPTYGSNSTVPAGTGLPVPTPSGSGAGAIKVASGMLMGIFGVAAFLL